MGELEPLAKQLIAEGYRDRELIAKLETVIQSRIKSLYNQRSGMTSGAELMDLVLREKKADSKIETIIYTMLLLEQIPFKFQYKIGSYRVDYLVDEWLVVEIDGPQHNPKYDEKRDTYLRGMGYEVFRVPIWMLSMNPSAVIEEIKDRIN